MRYYARRSASAVSASRSARNRFLGPLEAINVALMIGISTAALLAAFQDTLRKTSQTD